MFYITESFCVNKTLNQIIKCINSNQNHICNYIYCLVAQNAIGERRLLNDLLSDYDPRVRPVANFSSPIDVGILFILTRIESLVGAQVYICVFLLY